MQGLHRRVRGRLAGPAHTRRRRVPLPAAACRAVALGCRSFHRRQPLLGDLQLPHSPGADDPNKLLLE